MLNNKTKNWREEFRKKFTYTDRIGFVRIGDQVTKRLEKFISKQIKKANIKGFVEGLLANPKRKEIIKKAKQEVVKEIITAGDGKYGKEERKAITEKAFDLLFKLKPKSKTLKKGSE